MMFRRAPHRSLVFALLAMLVTGYGLLALHLGNPDEHPLDHRCELAAVEASFGSGLAPAPVPLPAAVVPVFAAPLSHSTVFISRHAPRPPARAPPVAHA